MLYEYQRVKLTTHIHLMPRLRYNEILYHTPYLHSETGKTVPSTLQQKQIYSRQEMEFIFAEA
jgi:hypothetical protein